MTPQDLTDDAKAILLLCGHFGRKKDPHEASPLSTALYSKFSSFLHQKQLRPASLLDESVLDELAQGICPIEVPRLKSLMSRGAAMGFAIEEWMNKGLWVICRSDQQYPARLKNKLRGMAPPILYGAGEPALLNGGGLAMIGSRKIGAEEEKFTSMGANRCACDGVQVVSGGARGVDQISMREAMAAGGTVVAALADSLLKKSLHKDNREALHDRRLVMISTVHPEAGFNVGAAMGRNKFIYALADFGLAVRAELKKGGTWSGAEEELKRDNANPVFLHPTFSGDKVRDALVERGARIFPELQPGMNIHQILSEASSQAVNKQDKDQDLFAAKPKEDTKQAEKTSTVEKTSSIAEPEKSLTSDKPEEKTSAPVRPTDSSNPPSYDTVFDAVWPLLAEKLTAPITSSDLAEALEVRKGQMDDWLKHAYTQGLTRKLSKPVRYALNTEPKLI
jgi:predicted Rossmann fold nucleotide-binding protein DprA/Smf involved in DNA uptake